MKKTIILLFIGALATMSSCKKTTNKTEISSELEKEKTEEIINFDWLLGKWKRSNGKDTENTYENWSKISKTEYKGVSYTIQDIDTVYQVKFKLIKLNDNWNFNIQLKGELMPSTFKMTSFNKDEFICENNQLNFPNKKLDSPNKIKYWKGSSENKIHVSISGGKIDLLFDFNN